MKQHIFSKGGLLLVFMLVFLAFFACRHDTQLEPMNTSSSALSAEVETAKAWFEKHSNTASVAEFKNIQPLWDKAKSFQGTVEVPYTVNGKTPMPKISNKLYQSGRQKLVLLKRGQNYQPSILSYIPSNDFEGHIKTINVRNLETEKFSGIASYQKWNEITRHNWHYKNGQVTKRTTAKVMSLDTPVPEFEVCDWVEYCIDWYQCTGSAGNPYEFCNYTDTQCGRIYVCVDDGGGSTNPCTDPSPPPFCTVSDPCDGPNPPPECGGSGGGGGGGGGNCLTGDCDPCELDPSLPDCKCPEKTGLIGTDKIGTFQHIVEISFTARLTGVSLRGGAYGLAPLQYNYQPLMGSTYSFTESSSVPENIFTESTCTRNITTSHWGQLTHSEAIGPIITNTSYPWGAFNYNWTFN